MGKIKYKKIIKWNWDELTGCLLYCLIFPFWIREVHYEKISQKRTNKIK